MTLMIPHSSTLVPPGGVHGIKPMDHQLAGIDILLGRPRFGYFWKPGLGKTLLILMGQSFRPVPTLVVCPKSIIKTAWVTDADTIKMPTTVYYGDPKRRTALREKIRAFPRRPVITNFDTFKADYKLLAALNVFERLVIDESSFARNRETKNWESLCCFADQIQSVYILSGTPAPNGPHEYWAQLRLLDPSPTGPAGFAGNTARQPNFWAWAAYWLVQHKRKIRLKRRNANGSLIVNEQGQQLYEERLIIEGYTINPARKAAWDEMLAKCTWALDAEQAGLNLPPERDIIVNVEMPAKQWGVYLQACKELRLDDATGSVTPITAAAKSMKTRQIVGGFVKAGEAWYDAGPAKLDALADLTQILEGEPFIVWTQFHREADAVFELLQKLNRKVMICDGRAADNSASVAAFVAGDLDTLVCHPRSVGHGITLVRSGTKSCRYDIWYSIPAGPESNEQGRARLVRTGQKSPVAHYYLCCTRTVDQSYYKAFKEGISESQAHLNAIADARRLAQET